MNTTNVEKNQEKEKTWLEMYVHVWLWMIILSTHSIIYSYLKYQYLTSLSVCPVAEPTWEAKPELLLFVLV